MKFGKHLQRRQLEIPEYSAAFVNYKGLKKLIKQLSATPVLSPQNGPPSGSGFLASQAFLQANKGTFFFKVEREIEKVNVCYLQKEAELRLRLKLLTDRKTMVQNASNSSSRNSASVRNLLQGFQQFNNDLSRLQQYIEVNGIAFSKILKKWDKSSKSKTKELYLSRAIEVQPFFNRDILRQLSDQATTDRLELEAWVEGERFQFNTALDPAHTLIEDGRANDDLDTDSQLLQAASAGEMESLQGWIARLQGSPEAKSKLTRTFLFSIADAPIAALELLINTKQVDIHAEDEISGRNCLHEAAINGREDVLILALENGVDPARKDVYGRIPLHYACMHGRLAIMARLLQKSPATINTPDHDRYTALIHGIVHDRLTCVHHLLSNGVRIEPETENDHIPLNLACQYGDAEIARLLLEMNARILADAEGLYPQHLVARSGKRPEILDLLQAHGANLDQRDKLYQWTPLFQAASEGRVNTLKALIEKSVDVDVEDEKGLPAMYYAAWEGHLECMQLLAQAHAARASSQRQQVAQSTQRLGPHEPQSATPLALSKEQDGIPDLELPPPIIPLRRYGHNFLDSKAYIQINFEAPAESGGADAILFYQDNKYPAARLTISSKSSDLIPRNIALPLQDEDSRRMSFQVENLSTFTLEFDIYPTFGARRIAHGVALPDVFTANVSSKGRCVVPLFDSRSRAIGRIEFKFQVIKPCTFPGAPVDLAGAGPLETYWKSTTQDIHEPDSLITGSSLNGEYVQLYVQLTRDGVPVLYPHWAIVKQGLPIQPVVACTSVDEFKALGNLGSLGAIDRQLLLSDVLAQGGQLNLAAVHEAAATSHLTLAEALEQLPQSVHVALNVLYPTPVEEKALRFNPALNINDFADAILRVVFDHARRTRGSDKAGYVRSFVFTSWNADICTALNWKQPNYPVLLCNNLGNEAPQMLNAAAAATTMAPSQNFAASTKPLHVDGRTSISVKEAVRIAQSNNFMGLVCSARLMKLVPALARSIKVAGLVLVSDMMSDSPPSREHGQQQWYSPPATTGPDGVDGTAQSNGVLKFNDKFDVQ